MTDTATHRVRVGNTVVNGHHPGTILAVGCDSNITDITPCVDPNVARVLASRGYVAWVDATGAPVDPPEEHALPAATAHTTVDGCAPCAAKRAAAAAAAAGES